MNMRRIIRTQRLLSGLGHADVIEALEELGRLREGSSAKHQDAQRLDPEGQEPGHEVTRTKD